MGLRRYEHPEILFHVCTHISALKALTKTRVRLGPSKFREFFGRGTVAGTSHLHASDTADESNEAELYKRGIMMAA